MKSKIIHISLQVLGTVMIFLGIIGLFLPVLQGILFIIIGLVLFSVSSVRTKEWINVRLQKFPRIQEMFNRQHGRITDKIKKHI